MKSEEFLSYYKAEYISSRSNAKVVTLGKLSDKKHRDREKLFLADGVKLAGEAVKYAHPEYLILAESALDTAAAKETADLYRAADIPVYVFSDAAFDKISTEKSPDGIIAALAYMTGLHTFTMRGDISKFDDWQQNRRLLLLDSIRDPGNLGTILRSAEAMGITGVILAGCADIYNRKTVRAAMGTLFRMPLFIADESIPLIRKMTDSGRRVHAAALGEHTLTLGDYEVLVTDCPVIGNEGHGLSADVIDACTACVRIPMAGNTESLNAAGAAMCILWESYRKFR
ncbi:MAG: RNA methyltransferase [Clostridia bacterium]|jgi:TrmH family RNA methyltransferase|nr:RNA methyltransferase [Clostridia bacterium]